MRRQAVQVSRDFRVARSSLASFAGLLVAGAVSVTALSAWGQGTAAGQAPKTTTAAKDAGAASSAGDAGTGALIASGADAGAPGPAVPIPDKGAMDGATYSVRLRDLEARVDELKDQIRRSHTRLALLSDTILSGGAAGSRAEVLFKNEMSSAFRLTRALFVVDGAVQYNKADDSGALADQKEIPIFSGSIPPGDHTVQVVLNFQGNGFGVFTYLRGYKFEVKSAHSFTSVEGKTLSLISTALEKGGVTTPLEQRPTIEWAEKVGALGSASALAPGSAPAAPAAGANVAGSMSVGGGK
ncbi:MAG: Dihydrolipoamide acetyltransferase component of pyruvate dehydrogenase complex [Labilithrix sp.]|nr:Dihydrolipoamide acetyltransferase component of pyruvate dehydrogenase complex [Labilithrix sp.]